MLYLIGLLLSLALLIPQVAHATGTLHPAGGQDNTYQYAGNITADNAVKNGPAVAHTISCAGTDAAATAGTIVLLDSTAAGTGNSIWTWNVQAVAITQPFTVILDARAMIGIFLDFTTTADVNCTVTFR